MASTDAAGVSETGLSGDTIHNPQSCHNSQRTNKVLKLIYKSSPPGFYNAPTILATSRIMPFRREYTEKKHLVYTSRFNLQNHHNDYITVFCRATDSQKFFFLPSPVHIIPPNQSLDIVIVTNPELKMNFNDFKNERIVVLASLISVEEATSTNQHAAFWINIANYWTKQRLDFPFPREHQIYLPPFELKPLKKENDKIEELVPSAYAKKDDDLDAYLFKSFNNKNLLHLPWFLSISLPCSELGDAVERFIGRILSARTLFGFNWNVRPQDDTMEDDISDIYSPEFLNVDENNNIILPEGQMFTDYTLKDSLEFLDLVIDSCLKKCERQDRIGFRIKRLNRCISWVSHVSLFLMTLILVKFVFYHGNDEAILDKDGKP